MQLNKLPTRKKNLPNARSNSRNQHPLRGTHMPATVEKKPITDEKPRRKKGGLRANLEAANIGKDVISSSMDIFTQGQGEVASGQYENLFLHQVDLDPKNPRKFSLDVQKLMLMDKESDSLWDNVKNLMVISPDTDKARETQVKRLRELTVSIRREGLLQPIVVYLKENGKYQSIAGHRRYYSSILAGKTKISAKVIPKPEYVRRIQFDENQKRDDLSAYETLQSVILAIEETKERGREVSTARDIAEHLAISIGTASNYQRLARLPDDHPVIQALKNKEINLKTAAYIAKSSHSEEEQLRMISDELNHTLAGSISKESSKSETIETTSSKPKAPAGRKAGKISFSTKNLAATKRIFTPAIEHLETIDPETSHALRQIDWEDYGSIKRMIERLFEAYEKLD